MRNASFVKKNALPKFVGDTRRYAENIVIDQYASIRDEWDNSSQVTPQYGYEKDMQTYTISTATSITKHMRDTGKEQDIIRNITNLSEVCPNTMDLDLAHRFSFAWSTSYTRTAGWKSSTIDVTVWDGLALISTVHKLTGSSTTYSNQLSGNGQFSKWALENMQKLFVEETYDNKWIKTYMEADTILTTDDPNTINQVRELLNATANVDTSNSGTFNVYKGGYKHVISHRIATTGTWAPDTTKRKYWFLISPMNSDLNLCILNEPYVKAPRDWNNGEDFLSENWNYMAVADYWIAAVTGKWVKGSKGDWS